LLQQEKLVTEISTGKDGGVRLKAVLHQGNAAKAVFREGLICFGLYFL